MSIHENHNDKLINVIILAAGVGSRLRPLTLTRPKCMVPVAGTPILERLLWQLGGMRGVVPAMGVTVVAGYLHAQVAQAARAAPLPVTVVVNEDYQATNNMYSLGLALQRPDAGAGDLVVINGDCVYADAIILRALGTPGSHVSIDRTQFNDESMKVRILDGRVTAMGKQLPQAADTAVSIDLYRFSGPERAAFTHEVQTLLEQGNRGEWTEVAIHAMVSTQPSLRLGGLDVAGMPWMEIDDLRDLQRADARFGLAD